MSPIQTPEAPATRSDLQAKRISQFTSTRNSRLLERATPALVFVTSLAYLCLFRHFSTRDLDEGIILQAAERVLRGQIPYRDFFLFYTPGSVYVQAALFKVFGDSLAVARTGIAFVGAVCTAVTYCLARRVCSRKISLLAAGMTTTVSVTYRFVVVHNWYSTLFACLSVYAAVRLLESGQKSWAFVTGSLIALTILTEQSKGAALLGGFVLGYLILLRRAAGKPAVTPSGLWAFGVGLIWPWLPTLVYFASAHSVTVMVQHWFWPLNHYTQANHVFYGHLSWPEEARNFLYTGPFWIRIWECLTLSPLLIFPVLPLVALAWLVFCMKQVWNQEHGSTDSGYYVLLSAICSGLLLSIVIVRTDITDFVYLAPLWYVVLAWVLQERNSYPLLQKLRPFLQAYIYIVFGMLGFALLLGANGASFKSQTRRGVLVTSARETVIQGVQERIAPGDELLVYPYLPLYNYLTATHSPAKLDFFQAGMNTAEQAESIIDSLQNRKTRWILFDPEFLTRIPYVWPHTPIAVVANDPVADYIVSHYEICAVLPSGASLNFQLMALKTMGCGPSPQSPSASPSY